mmetsp:Transcript_65411/g.102974  ORF Transcript_65411/g.102974 Transcript_65411/m.102974 type:complete len:206 (+) Transcript_65411:1633-2250(+)
MVGLLWEVPRLLVLDVPLAMLQTRQVLLLLALRVQAAHMLRKVVLPSASIARLGNIPMPLVLTHVQTVLLGSISRQRGRLLAWRAAQVISRHLEVRSASHALWAMFHLLIVRRRAHHARKESIKMLLACLLARSAPLSRTPCCLVQQESPNADVKKVFGAKPLQMHANLVERVWSAHMAVKWTTIGRGRMLGDQHRGLQPKYFHC